MAEKGSLQYKLSKITTKTVPAAIIGAIMIYLARDKTLKLAWFVPGAVVTFLGEWLRVWAAGHLKKNRELTTTGPYSYVKNPLYIGTLLITIGFSAMAQNIYILIGGFAWFFVYYAPYKKKQETEKLVSSFGDAWTVYDQAVPDYVPRLTPYRGKNMNRWNIEVVRENSEHETAIAVFMGFAVLLYLLMT